MRQKCLFGAGLSLVGVITSIISFCFDPAPLDIIFGGIFGLLTVYFAIGAWRAK